MPRAGRRNEAGLARLHPVGDHGAEDLARLEGLGEPVPDALLAVGELADPEGAGLLASNGLLLVVATLVTAPVIVALIVLFAWARRGLPVLDYLGWRALSRADWMRWLALTLLFVVIMGS